MRFINEIGPKKTIQMTAGGHRYVGKVDHENEWIGWHCELTICSRDVISGTPLTTEIEGSGEDVIHALESAVLMLKGYEVMLKRDSRINRRRSKKI